MYSDPPFPTVAVITEAPPPSGVIVNDPVVFKGAVIIPPPRLVMVPKFIEGKSIRSFKTGSPSGESASIVPLPKLRVQLVPSGEESVHEVVLLVSVLKSKKGNITLFAKTGVQSKTTKIPIKNDLFISLLLQDTKVPQLI
jgi:hypothetical protein